MGAMHSKKSIFFGSSYKVAQLLDRLCPLTRIYCERKQFNSDLFNLANFLNCSFTIVDHKSDLNLLPIRDEVIALSFGFGIIFTQQHIDAFPYGIWNIHTGKLPELRGRHPITWAFLKGHREFIISIHEMNAEIDQGFLLAEGRVLRDLNDTQETVERKFEDLLQEHLLQDAYDNYFAGKKAALDKGNYTKSLIGGFADIVPEEHDSAFIFNLSKAQSKYGGFTVHGKQYKECVFVHEEFPELYSKYALFICKDKVKIGLI